MIKVPDPKELQDFDLQDFQVEPFKYVERRGYMYILVDSVFPDYVKVGRTQNVYKRLQAYNSDKPYPTAKIIYISRLFDDCHEVEKKVLQYLYDCTNPTTLSKEWFEIKHKDLIIDIITKQESIQESKQDKEVQNDIHN